MATYRRYLTKGGTWFFTVNLANRKSSLLTENIDNLRNAFKYVNHRHPFTINAIVILPDHIHAIWTLPENDSDFSTRWRLIKTEFSRKIPKYEKITSSRLSKNERGIWQRRFWEHKIRDDSDYARHVDYIHINPVKHGYVNNASEWLWSSFHRYVKDGIIATDWAADVDSSFDFGELR